MRVAIGSDHAGFALKEAVKAFLTEEHREVLDLGTHSSDPVDYSDYAEAVGRALRENRVERGILLCGSGVGASMAANRIPGIRAGLCHDTYSAHQGVEHDDMNVLVLGGRIVGVELARELIGAFLNARFSGEARHRRRLAKMTALENPLRALQVLGQSVWLDYIRRSLITSGELRRLIDEDGLRGVTSNPAIFEKAITRKLRVQRQSSSNLTSGSWTQCPSTSDWRSTIFGTPPMPCALFTRRRRGVTATSVWRCRRLLAYDTAATLDGSAPVVAQRSDAKTLMIKVPATPQGIAAIQAADRRGNQRQCHAAVCTGRLRARGRRLHSGLETYADRDGDLRRVASVASFFISRIDSAIDALVDGPATGRAEREREQAYCAV